MTFEKYDFFCPKCDFSLDSNNSIELDVKRANGDGAKIFMSKTVGHYEHTMKPPLELIVGEELNFNCPSCNSCLNSNSYKGFATIKMIAEQKFDFEVLFSRQAGIQKTYIVTEDGMECYGRDCDL